MSNLLICCDGTWNDEADRTHIYRIAEAAKKLTNTSTKVFYDTGVGTDIYRLTGGGLGKGLSANIRQAYGWLVTNWQPGDQIFVVGFSRGAYTARSLCGFLRFAGLLRIEDTGNIGTDGENALVEEAYTAYRLRDEKERLAHHFRSGTAYKQRRTANIRFLGVFDTVGALGVPINWLQGIANKAPLLNVEFHDTQLSENVEIACHALAIDERRGPFVPTLWTGQSSPDQHIKQVWFSGVHSDVGGGYPDDKSLAEIPLRWMLQEMAAAGLDLLPGFASHDPLASIDKALLGTMHDSMDGKYLAVHHLPSIDPVVRPIGTRQRPSNHPTVPGEMLHWSVQERVLGEAATQLRSQHRPYRPVNLRVGAEGLAIDIPIETQG